MSSLALLRLLVSAEVSDSGPQTRVIHVARGHLVRWWIWPCCGWVGFVELDVASSQEARGNDDGRTEIIRKFQAKLVWPGGTRAWFSAVVGPGSKIDWAKEVGIGGTADIAILWVGGILAAANTGVKVPGDLGAADVESGPHTGRIVVDEVKMAEESTILAASHKAKVRVVPTVGKRLIGNDKSPTGGEVARNGKHVGGYRCGFYTHH